jgi:hypothetical protein
MILIKCDSKYITRKNMSTDFTLTNNINFAYTFEDKKQAEQFIKFYNDKFQNMIIEEC